MTKLATLTEKIQQQTQATLKELENYSTQSLQTTKQTIDQNLQNALSETQAGIAQYTEQVRTSLTTLQTTISQATTKMETDMAQALDNVRHKQRVVSLIMIIVLVLQTGMMAAGVWQYHKRHQISTAIAQKKAELRILDQEIESLKRQKRSLEDMKTYQK